MQNNLSSIFHAITPDNIKDIKVIEDSMKIFIELLSEHSSISTDIRHVLSEETTESISEELYKIYLYDYYSMIQNLKTNKEIVNKFRLWNRVLNPELYPDNLPYIGDKLIINYFKIGIPGSSLFLDNSGDSNFTEFNLSPLSKKLDNLEYNLLQNKAENYFVNRLFKESKGLKKGIKFIYDILNEHLVDKDERRELVIQETGNPFELIINGSIDKDIYRESIAYLSHPLGFVYDYTYISELRIDDNYLISSVYNINTLEVRCLSGMVETYNKDVQYINKKDNYTKILFKDGYYLLQENDIVKYFDNNDNLVKIYPGNNHCSIYVDYEIVTDSILKDKAVFEQTSTLQTEEFPEIYDAMSFFEDLEFKINYLVGVSIIGEDLISRDTDAFETLNIKEEFLIETF